MSKEALAFGRGAHLDTGDLLDELKWQPANDQAAYVEHARGNAGAAKELDDAVEAREIEELASRLSVALSIEQQEYAASAPRLPAKKIARANAPGGIGMQGV